MFLPRATLPMGAGPGLEEKGTIHLNMNGSVKTKEISSKNRSSLTAKINSINKKVQPKTTDP